MPSYTSRVLVEVLRCRGVEGCPLWLRMRAKAPPLHNSTALDCREHARCQLALDLPFWQHWYYVLVEKHPGVPGTVSFQVTVQLTGEGSWGGVGGGHGLESAWVTGGGVEDALRIWPQLGTGLYPALLGWRHWELLGLGCRWR